MKFLLKQSQYSMRLLQYLNLFKLLIFTDDVFNKVVIFKHLQKIVSMICAPDKKGLPLARTLKGRFPNRTHVFTKGIKKPRTQKKEYADHKGSL